MSTENDPGRKAKVPEEFQDRELENASVSPGNMVGTPAWYIFRGETASAQKEKGIRLPSPPPWRDFSKNRNHKGRTFRVNDEQVQLVNAALYLRRPLLITGLPGTGKSSLAYAVAEELGLGQVLKWPITSRSSLQDGLYSYDSIGRLQSSNLSKTSAEREEPPPIGQFIRLGPLGTALADSYSGHPRVLLIDELDKSDIDLPNDLLNVFEDGEFEIPELARLAEKSLPEGKKKTSTDRISVRLDRPRYEDGSPTIEVVEGRVRCREFPFVILTSNGERELPAPFLRRCLRLDIKPPNETELQRIVRAHFNELADKDTLPDTVVEYIGRIVKRRREKKEYVATDQLLNAVYLILNEKVESSLRDDQRTKTLLEKFVLETIGTSLL